MAAVVFDGGFGGFDGGSGLGELGLIVVVLKFDERIAGVDFLIVGDFYGADDASDFRAQGSEVAADYGVVGDLLDFSAFPGVPVSREGDDDGCGEQQNDKRRGVFEPGPARFRRCRGVFGLGGICGR